MKYRSTIGETLVELMKIVHDQLKDHLEKSIAKYKDKEDQNKKESHFKVGDLVMAFLKNEMIPKGIGNKLWMKALVHVKYYANMTIMHMS